MAAETTPDRAPEEIKSTVSVCGLAKGSGVDEASTHREGRLVLIGAVLLAIFACWWSTLGASLSDDAHNIALAWRLSLGDAPFVDEMNTQALGSLIAVPFTWGWTHLFGMTALVLASRIYFVAVAFGFGFLAYTALRTRLRPVTAAIGVAVPLMALPYHLGQVSYNTMPIMCLVLGTAAGFAAIVGHNPRWAFVSGAAVALAVISFPLVAIAGVIIPSTVAGLVRRRDVIVRMLLGGLSVAIPFGLWILLRIGPSAVADTLHFTLEYQHSRRPIGERSRLALDMYTSNLWLRKYWPMWAAVFIAVIPMLRRHVRTAAVATIPGLAAAPSVHTVLTGPTGLAFGKLAGVYATVLSLALLVPVILWAAQRRRRDMGVLLTLSLPVALLQVPLIASMTSSSVEWGVSVIGVSTLLMALSAGWCEMVAEWLPRAQPIISPLLVVMLAMLLALNPFKDPFPWQLTSHISTGPFAGISTTAAKANRISQAAEAGKSWTEPGEGVLLYGLAGDYLFIRGEPVTNILWLSDFGSANQATLDYFERSGRTPDVVFVNRLLVDKLGGYDNLAARDPLIAYIIAHYHVVDPEAGVATVFRRN